MRSWTSRVIRTSALAALFACSSVNTYSTGAAKSNVEVAEIVRDPLLASDITLKATRLDERAGVRFAQVTVLNGGGSGRAIEVQWTWLDASGISLGGNRSWLRYDLSPGEMRDLQSAGPSEGKNYRLAVRPATN